MRRKFGDVREICIGPKLDSCRFLYACINKAMRLSPATGAILPREVLKGGLEVEGEFLPAGTDVGVPVYAVQHVEECFPRPFAFEPERWILEDFKDSEKERRAAVLQSAFCPFGWGRTSCIGKYLAYQEMGLILARVLWLYDMRLQDGITVGEGNLRLGRGRERKEEFQMYDVFVSTRDGPWVQFRPASH